MMRELVAIEPDTVNERADVIQGSPATVADPVLEVSALQRLHTRIEALREEIDSTESTDTFGTLSTAAALSAGFEADGDATRLQKLEEEYNRDTAALHQRLKAMQTEQMEQDVVGEGEQMMRFEGHIGSLKLILKQGDGSHIAEVSMDHFKTTLTTRSDRSQVSTLEALLVRVNRDPLRSPTGFDTVLTPKGDKAKRSVEEMVSQKEAPMLYVSSHQKRTEVSTSRSNLPISRNINPDPKSDRRMVGSSLRLSFL